MSLFHQVFYQYLVTSVYTVKRTNRNPGGFKLNMIQGA
jgi:hypothetical protein